LEWNGKVMEIHGGMYSGDARQKHNAKTLWNYVFMEMHVDEIGIIVGAFLFYAIKGKKIPGA